MNFFPDHSPFELSPEAQEHLKEMRRRASTPPDHMPPAAPLTPPSGPVPDPGQKIAREVIGHLLVAAEYMVESGQYPEAIDLIQEAREKLDG